MSASHINAFKPAIWFDLMMKNFISTTLIIIKNYCAKCLQEAKHLSFDTKRSWSRTFPTIPQTSISSTQTTDLFMLIWDGGREGTLAFPSYSKRFSTLVYSLQTNNQQTNSDPVGNVASTKEETKTLTLPLASSLASLHLAPPA